MTDNLRLIERYFETREDFNRSRDEEVSQAVKDTAYAAVTAAWYRLRPVERRCAGMHAKLMGWHA